MTRIFVGCMSLSLLLAGDAALPAQSPSPSDSGEPRAGTEALTAWEWFDEFQLPNRVEARNFDFLLTPDVLDKARADLADLRLYNGQNREVPYALRIRRAEDQQESLNAKEFNRAAKPDRSVEVSLDLGEGAVEHNEVEILTRGTSFRRRVRIEGSDADKKWSVLLDRGYVVHHQVDAQTVAVNRLLYPPSRFRYLRVQVFADASTEDDKPALATISVFRSVREPGEYVTAPATLGVREAVRADGGPGSAWTIGFDGDMLPCEKLTFDVEDSDFVRTYRLETANPGEPIQYVAGGDWRRRAGSEHKPLEIKFGEVTSRQLRLVVTDNRNPPLNITAARYTAAARQVIFAGSAGLAPPLRLYFGNPNAEPPRYDFAANLPARLQSQPTRVNLGSVVQNPDYQLIPKPWTERWPWLVYVVLGAASLVLLGILSLLARQAMAQKDATGPREAVTR